LAKKQTNTKKNIEPSVPQEELCSPHVQQGKKEGKYPGIRRKGGNHKIQGGRTHLINIIQGQYTPYPTHPSVICLIC
jgi:hypothetical protein